MHLCVRKTNQQKTGHIPLYSAQMHLSIHAFNTHFLRTGSFPGTVQGAGYTKMMRRSPCSQDVLLMPEEG